MKQTEHGRVTEEYLDQLCDVANMHKKPWQMGCSSHVMKALVEEIQEYRDLKSKIVEDRL